MAHDAIEAADVEDALHGSAACALSHNLAVTALADTCKYSAG